MTTSNPEDIRRDIEATRDELSRDVDALAEKVSPARVVERKVDRAKDAVSNVKEKVMGSPSSHEGFSGEFDSGSEGNGLGGAGDKISSAASSVADSASSAPQQARARTRGNPLAAGLIAFGAGWLVSSLLPATDKEEQAAEAVKAKASEHSDALKKPFVDAAGELKDNLKEPAQQAAESVRSTAAEGAETVQADARHAKDDVAGQARDAKDTVADDASSTDGATDLRDAPLGSQRPA